MTADSYLLWRRPNCNKPSRQQEALIAAPWEMFEPVWAVIAPNNLSHNWRTVDVCVFVARRESHPGRAEETVQMEVRVGLLASHSVFVLFFQSPPTHWRARGWCSLLSEGILHLIFKSSLGYKLQPDEKHKSRQKCMITHALVLNAFVMFTWPYMQHYIMDWKCEDSLRPPSQPPSIREPSSIYKFICFQAAAESGLKLADQMLFIALTLLRC